MNDSPGAFTFREWDADEASGDVRFHYAFDNGMEFCETVSFNAPLPSRDSPHRRYFDSAVDALSIAAGISYYKAFLPRRISLSQGRLTASQRNFFQKLYVNGLGEFGYRNQINVSERINFLADEGPSGSAEAPPLAAKEVVPPLPRRSAVLIGGGKDSIVSVEALRSAGEPLVLFAVNPKRPIIACAEAASLPFISVSRRIDPRLFQLNDLGAFNGHVPITAIVSLIAVAGSFVHGYDTVVLSNERSANEGNVAFDGHIVNHQYSKTVEFERDLRAYLSAHVFEGLTYFSMLRPLSELHIARLLARTERYDTSFSSCNRSFRILQPQMEKRWCCDCPKCRFTFLALATVMPPERLLNIFGADILNDASQIAGYEELTGLSGHKPWECVGEIAESSVAMLQLAERPAWSDSLVVSTLAPRLQRMIRDPGKVQADLLTPDHDNHCMPKRYEEMLDAYIGAR